MLEQALVNDTARYSAFWVSMFVLCRCSTSMLDTSIGIILISKVIHAMSFFSHKSSIWQFDILIVKVYQYYFDNYEIAVNEHRCWTSQHRHKMHYNTKYHWQMPAPYCYNVFEAMKQKWAYFSDSRSFWGRQQPLKSSTFDRAATSE